MTDHEALLIAVKSGEPEWITDMAQIPWEDTRRDGNPLPLMFTRLTTPKPNDHDRVDTSMALVLARAARDGIEEMFELQPVLRRDVSFVDPVLSFIEHGFTKALAQHMDHGFDPLAVHGHDGHTALSIAQNMGKHGVENTILAHVARSKAHGLIDGIEQEMKAGTHERHQP